MPKEKIIIIYHGDCHDGFGGAFAAWKKFGDSAAYIPAHDRAQPEIDITGKETYIIDFSYPKETLLELEQKAERLIVLDHHISAKESVQAVREHIFDNNLSGAGIAWKYFHPETQIPRLLAYVQANDLWRFTLPHSREVGKFLSTVNFSFSDWEKLAQRFENENDLRSITEHGEIYCEYFDFICDDLVKQAELVEFDGHKVLAVNAPRIFRSELGHKLALKHPPFAIVWGEHQGIWQFSLRGDGSIDLTEIAGRYGGGGHKNASAFRLPLDAPLPFKIIGKLDI
ncbi:MAG: Phosphoesterase, DHHA1 [Parcubacteria group bacterium GW2011_GWD2_38_12]|uniref:DHHA1 domain-containing protein n=1 Tax=Candidatus Azambacteria bacterium RIFCSPLOWO2_01_FULL_37_9 TaxID=1797297 RepID=A0A1F5C7J2_9BACT|nr:MAG: Phosphoesterase, DHHA1 [Parcubacteria group bacterium GW2011_GWC2_36_17]KKQ39309.1 MAG: Phosphoesterase, DHHA1 [Candidatus Moranbacteria bacterium GW2011_GWF2_37_7]KKQ43837.1 MAG: Phosphoesterase, DHHA1 [Parcubacteria group bacterium GW2011_GWE2_37_8]KKQ51735.1 MAG: Phosphoesterase, DHHA1 [Parcubacteria group bacterium GW2011_GWD2_38_12]KKQ58180.1 MAG: Phosphoesterase, DHHA1 [Parcubacteria group bacterium GW2011_GWD1_38_16]KKQ58198.1 MAG: Phosphoesterase, DHHA1 [Parcubacteria group bac